MALGGLGVGKNPLENEAERFKAEHKSKTSVCSVDEVLSECVSAHSHVKDPSVSDPWEWQSLPLVRPRDIIKPYNVRSANSDSRNHQTPFPPTGRLQPEPSPLQTLPIEVSQTSLLVQLYTKKSTSSIQKYTMNTLRFYTLSVAGALNESECSLLEASFPACVSTLSSLPHHLR